MSAECRRLSPDHVGPSCGCHDGVCTLGVPAPHDRKEAYDLRNARNNPRRVGHGRNYLGMAPRKDQAAHLNALRKEFHDRQKQSRA